jgi:hypothetical protein
MSFLANSRPLAAQRGGLSGSCAGSRRRQAGPDPAPRPSPAAVVSVAWAAAARTGSDAAVCAAAGPGPRAHPPASAGGRRCGTPGRCSRVRSIARRCAGTRPAAGPRGRCSIRPTRPRSAAAAEELHARREELGRSQGVPLVRRLVGGVGGEIGHQRPHPDGPCQSIRGEYRRSKSRSCCRTFRRGLRPQPMALRRSWRCCRVSGVMAWAPPLRAGGRGNRQRRRIPTPARLRCR